MTDQSLAPPPAIGTPDRRGILVGSADPDAGADYPEHAIPEAPVVEDYAAIAKRLREIKEERG